MARRKSGFFGGWLGHRSADNHALDNLEATIEQTQKLIGYRAKNIERYRQQKILYKAPQFQKYLDELITLETKQLEVNRQYLTSVQHSLRLKLIELDKK